MEWKQGGFSGLGECTIAPAFSECAMKWFPVREGTGYPMAMCSLFFFMETLSCEDCGLVFLTRQKHPSHLQSKDLMREWVLWWGLCLFSLWKDRARNAMQEKWRWAKLFKCSCSVVKEACSMKSALELNGAHVAAE